MCSAPAGLKHILVGCKTSLSQGRYTWRHNQVLRCLASAIEQKRTATNAAPLNTHPEASTAFIREGERQPTRAALTISSLIGTARDWQLLVDLDKSLVFPPNIAVSSLRPDLVLWSNSCRRVYIIELTVPWEEAIDEAYERKRLRYSDLAAQAEERGWTALVRPVTPERGVV